MQFFSSKEPLRQAEKYVREGKFALAIKEYESVLQHSPKDATLMNTIGDLCIRANRPGDATRYFLKVADIYRDGGHNASAIAVLKKVAKLDPGNVEIASALGDLYLKQGLIQDSIAQYTTVAEAYKGSLNQNERALWVQRKICELDPENADLKADLGESFLAKGYTHEAFQLFTQAGQEYRRQGKLEESLAALRKALVVKPDSKLPLNAISEVLFQLGRVDEALELLNATLAKTPLDIDLSVIIGRTYLMAKRLDEAEVAFTSLLELDPTRYDYLLEVGKALLERGQYDRTVSIVERCVDPMLARRHKKRATALLKEVIRKDPDNIAALRVLASIYTKVNEKRNVITTLNALVGAALRTGHKDLASHALKRLIEIDPDGAYEQQLEDLDSTGAPTPAQDAAAAAVVTSQSGIDGEYSTELLESMVAQHPEFLEARIRLLEDLVASQPKYLEGRLKLKQHYLERGQREKALEQCRQLSRLYAEYGDHDAAARYRDEAAGLEETVIAAPPPASVGEVSPSKELDLAFLSELGPGGEGHGQSTVDEEHHDEVMKLEELPDAVEFAKFLDYEFRRASRLGRPLTVARVAVDGLLDYIEANGLLGGDRCLEAVSGALERELRGPGDVLGRDVGEGFSILANGLDAGDAVAFGNGLRRAVEALELVHGSGQREGQPITISIGLTSVRPRRGIVAEDILEAATSALRQARAEGGNRVVEAAVR